MYFCRFCGTELEKDNNICPSCGKNNDFGKPAKKKLTQKQIKTIVAVAVLVAILIPAVYFGVGLIKDLARPNDIFYSDKYIVSVEDMNKHRDEVVATYGDYTLTNKMLQVFFWGRVYEFMEYAGDYASYYGLSYNKPLSEQVYDTETGKTWEHMFLEQSVNDWQNYVVMSEAGKKVGFEMPARYQKLLDEMEADLTEQAKTAKLETAAEFLDKYVCPGCTLEDYKDYYELIYYSQGYYDYVTENWEVTDAEMDTYFSENAAALKQNYKVDKTTGLMSNVRHILILVETNGKDDENKAISTDEDWAKCKEEAQKVLDQWLAGDKTEESFAELAMELSEDGGSKSNGGLYTAINKDTTFVKPFLDWCIDENRKVGDYDLVKTSYGYHVMFFSERDDGWKLYCRPGVKSEKTTAHLQELRDASGITFNFKKIAIVEVSLTGK